jgi:uncharacterized protein YqeY
MNDNRTYERLIKKKTEGKTLLSKILLIIFYVAFAAVCIPLIILIGKANPLLFVLGAIAEWLLIKFTWRLTEIEYEYSVFDGIFTISKILGKSSRRDIFENALSEAAIVAPYIDEYRKKAEEKSVTRTIKAISSESAENVWFILFEKENGENALILFEADEKSLRIIRTYCPRAVAREKLKSVSNEVNEVKKEESEN